MRNILCKDKLTIKKGLSRKKAHYMSILKGSG